MTRVTDAVLAHLRSLGSADATEAGRYLLGEVIGEGGMGTVHRAHDAELDREVAVKVLRDPADPAWLERFRQEARIIASLEHPGIVPVHDSGVLSDGRPFYVMTLVRGDRLDRFLAGRTDMAERLRLFLRILEPIAFAHSAGVVHRDLKPANIMVGPYGEVLVMDWGLAQAPGFEAEPGVAVGTAGFIAPEQAQGNPIDARSDVYSLGALLDWVAGAAAPPPVRAIADRAKAAEPSRRYPTVGQLSAEISRFLAGEPVEAYPESMRERLVRVAARNRTALLLISGYLIMRLVLLLGARS